MLLLSRGRGAALKRVTHSKDGVVRESESVSVCKA